MSNQLIIDFSNVCSHGLCVSKRRIVSHCPLRKLRMCRAMRCSDFLTTSPLLSYLLAAQGGRGARFRKEQSLGEARCHWRKVKRRSFFSPPSLPPPSLPVISTVEVGTCLSFAAAMLLQLSGGGARVDELASPLHEIFMSVNSQLIQVNVDEARCVKFARPS